MNRRIVFVGIVGILLFTFGIIAIVRMGDARVSKYSSNVSNDMGVVTMFRGESGAEPSMGSAAFHPMDSVSSMMYPPTTGSGITTVGERMIVKTGDFSVVVTNVATRAREIGSAVEERGGIVVSSQVYDMDTIPRASIVVRVPAEKFDEVVADIRKTGVIKSESVHGQDVTEEYVDLDAQLRNFKATESQFLEIMKRATAIQDILAVQRELMTVRGSIESIEGRMKYLTESAEYSTISIYLSSDSASLPIVDESDEWKLVGELRESLRSLVEFGKELMSVVVWIAVFTPVWGLVGLVAWLIVRKIRNKSSIS
jgi:hypothetical protein